MTNLIKTSFRKLHLDYHQPPWMKGVAESFTEEEANQQALLFKQSGVEVVEYFAYDHHGQAFYPSDVAIVHPGLASDYTGLMTKALKKQGIKTILYLNAFTSIHLDKIKPEWIRTLEDGSKPKGAWLQYEASHICISSAYLQEYFIPLLREAIQRHQPDSVWIDTGSWMVDFQCYCENCQRLYNMTGFELPKGPLPLPIEELEHPSWVRWRIWRRGQIYTYVQEMIKAIKEVSPTTLVAENNLCKSFTGVPLVDNGQFVRWLQPKELGVDWLSCDPVHFGANHEMILSREGRYQATSGLAFDFMLERFHGWGEWQLRSPTDWKLEIATILAVGGSCFVADQPFPNGKLETAVYQDLRDLYNFVQEREPYALEAVPVAEVGVLASLPSQLFGPTAGPEWGRHSWGMLPLSRTDRIDGASMLMSELGSSYLIYDEASLRNVLHSLKLVIIADQMLMEDATIQALEQYVQGGGRVVVTGRSGLYDEQGLERTSDPFAKLLGLERTGTQPAPIHYWKAGEQWESSLPYGSVNLQVWGSATTVQISGARPLAELIEPNPHVWKDGIRDREHWQHYTTVGATPAGTETVGIAAAEHSFGLGKALYLNSDLFSLYYTEGHRITRQWLFHALEWIFPTKERTFSIQKPLHVEVFQTEQKHHQRVHIHMVNYFAQKRPGYVIHNEEVPTIDGIEMTLQSDREPTQVTAEPGHTRLEFDWDGHYVKVTAPRLHLHEVITFQY